jgi:hypothetical protein
MPADLARCGISSSQGRFLPAMAIAQSITTDNTPANRR